MRGLRVNFSEEGASIDFNDSVNNFYSTVQNAVVNVGTKKETDKIFISKGTTFFEKAVAGGVNTLLEASHSSNFAADETLRFYQKTDNNTDVKLAVFRLTPTSFVQGEKLEVSVYAESSDGHIVQTLTTL